MGSPERRASQTTGGGRGHVRTVRSRWALACPAHPAHVQDAWQVAERTEPPFTHLPNGGTHLSRLLSLPVPKASLGTGPRLLRVRWPWPTWPLVWVSGRGSCGWQRPARIASGPLYLSRVSMPVSARSLGTCREPPALCWPIRLGAGPWWRNLARPGGPVLSQKPENLLPQPCYGQGLPTTHHPTLRLGEGRPSRLGRGVSQRSSPAPEGGLPPLALLLSGRHPPICMKQGPESQSQLTPAHTWPRTPNPSLCHKGC